MMIGSPTPMIQAPSAASQKIIFWPFIGVLSFPFASPAKGTRLGLDCFEHPRCLIQTGMSELSHTFTEHRCKSKIANIFVIFQK
jgi:hypothetical protein